jgi:hypothetical protein
MQVFGQKKTTHDREAIKAHLLLKAVMDETRPTQKIAPAAAFRRGRALQHFTAISLPR